MSFTADLSGFRTAALGSIDKVIQRIIIEVGNRTVYRSPVGDATYWQSPPPPGYAGGRFRANWQYGYGSYPGKDLPDIDPSGQSAISRIIAGTMSNKAVGVHYIVNNLPYAQALEDGRSKRQAPQGIIGLVELEFPQIVAMATA